MTSPSLSKKTINTLFLYQLTRIGLEKAVKSAFAFFFCEYTLQSSPKIWHHFCTPYLHQMLIIFQTYFTVRIRRKLEIIPSLMILSHLECFVTLSREMSVSPDSDSELSLKIGPQYLTKLRRTKKWCRFLGHPVQGRVHVDHRWHDIHVGLQLVWAVSIYLALRQCL